MANKCFYRILKKCASAKIYNSLCNFKYLWKQQKVRNDVHSNLESQIFEDVANVPTKCISQSYWFTYK